MALHKKQSEDKFWLYCVTIGKNLFDGALVAWYKGATIRKTFLAYSTLKKQMVQQLSCHQIDELEGNIGKLKALKQKLYKYS